MVQLRQRRLPPAREQKGASAASSSSGLRIASSEREEVTPTSEHGSHRGGESHRRGLVDAAATAELRRNDRLRKRVKARRTVQLPHGERLTHGMGCDVNGAHRAHTHTRRESRTHRSQRLPQDPPQVAAMAAAAAASPRRKESALRRCQRGHAVRRVPPFFRPRPAALLPLAIHGMWISVKLSLSRGKRRVICRGKRRVMVVTFVHGLPTNG